MSGTAPRVTAEPAVVESRGPRTPAPTWRLRTRDLSLERPCVMAVLNLTPDSFSDGGRFATVAAQRLHARRLVEAGADMLDVGAESTRPGARAVAPEEQWARLEPVLEVCREWAVPVSVDTRSSEVASRALGMGVEIVNDVSGLQFDPAMASVVADTGAAVILMHMRGVPADMAEHALYADITREVCAELREALVRAREAGVSEERIVVDPGIGFAKTVRHSLALLGELKPLLALGRPLMVGPSRKRFLAGPEDLAPDARVPGTVAACVLAYQQGVRLFRVHDVAPVRRALELAYRVEQAVAGEALCEGRGDVAS